MPASISPWSRPCRLLHCGRGLSNLTIQVFAHPYADLVLVGAAALATSCPYSELVQLICWQLLPKACSTCIHVSKWAQEREPEEWWNIRLPPRHDPRLVALVGATPNLGKFAVSNSQHWPLSFDCLVVAGWVLGMDGAKDVLDCLSIFCSGPLLLLAQPPLVLKRPIKRPQLYGRDWCRPRMLPKAILWCIEWAQAEHHDQHWWLWYWARERFTD